MVEKANKSASHESKEEKKNFCSKTWVRDQRFKSQSFVWAMEWKKASCFKNVIVQKSFFGRMDSSSGSSKQEMMMEILAKAATATWSGKCVRIPRQFYESVSLSRSSLLLIYLMSLPSQQQYICDDDEKSLCIDSSQWMSGWNFQMLPPYNSTMPPWFSMLGGGGGSVNRTTTSHYGWDNWIGNGTKKLTTL